MKLKTVDNKVACGAIVLLSTSSILSSFMGFTVWRSVYSSQDEAMRKPLRRNCAIFKRNELVAKSFADLSEEFKAQASVLRLQSNDVLKALQSDGYVTFPLSMHMSGPTIQKQAEDNLAVNSATNATMGTSTNESKSLDFLVPNVVHYIVFGKDLSFTFVNYLSYRSVERFVQPEYIFVHGDNIPSGHWWNLTIHNVRNIYHVNRTCSRIAPNGKPFRYAAHVSDYLRTEIMFHYGGIYLDPDVLVVKSFAPLRRYSITLGRESPWSVCNGIIIAERGAPFLRILREQYYSYKGKSERWAEISVLNTHVLAKLFPHLVHIEEKTLNRPNYRERAFLYDWWYNWTQNYAIHLWMRLWPKEKRPKGFKDILTKSSTFAEVARLIVFGVPDPRPTVTGQLYGALYNRSDTALKLKTRINLLPSSLSFKQQTTRGTLKI